MIKKHSFANPFPSIRQKFGKNGRSNSAPGAFDVIQVNKSFVNNIKNIYKMYSRMLAALQQQWTDCPHCQKTQLRRRRSLGRGSESRIYFSISAV